MTKSKSNGGSTRALVSSEQDRRSALASAGNILTRLREYQAAADLIEASTSGQTTTAANTQRIALLRKTQRVDALAVEPVDPRGVVLRAFGDLLAPSGDHAAFRKRLSRRSAAIAEAADFERAQRAMINGLTRQDLPFEVGADLLFSNVRVNVEGDDALGYRVQLRASGDTETFYVVKEDGAEISQLVLEANRSLAEKELANAEVIRESLAISEA